MKKILFALMGICALMFSACSSSDNNDNGIQNSWMLTKESKTLYDSDTEGVKVTVTLKYEATENITITPQIIAEAGLEGVLEINPTTITIAKGTKKAEFYVRSTGKKLISESGKVSVSLGNVAGLAAGEILSITVEPKAVVADLTNEQKALVQKWMENYGFDVRPLLGQHNVTTTITFSDDDKTELGYETNDVEYDQDFSIFAISDNATEDNIVLKMTTNPMGLQAFMQEALGMTFLNYEGGPVYDAFVTLVGEPDVSTLKATLDGIVINPETGEISFVADVAKYDAEETKTIVPFTYYFPQWATILQKANAGEVFVLGESEELISDHLEEDGTFDPAWYFDNSDISGDNDEYWHEPSNLIAPTATYDANNNTLTFNFSWDFGAGSILYDYVKVNVVYNLNDAE